MAAFPQLHSGSAVALGYFDGVHRGHLAVLNAALAAAREEALAPVVVSFDFSNLRPGGKGEKDLLAPQDNQAIIEQLGFAQFVRLDFARVSEWPPEQFVRQVLGPEAARAKKVFCGGNFRFGAGAKGNAMLLRALCAPMGCEVVTVADVADEGLISTGRIKKLVACGDVELATRLLSRSYGFSMTVEPGQRLGRTMGFPTINHHFSETVVVPRFGVYKSTTTLEGKTYKSVTNIGVRPTVSTTGVVTAETHILDYTGEIYGARAYVALTRFLRPEKRFETKQALTAAIAADVAAARRD